MKSPLHVDIEHTQSTRRLALLVEVLVNRGLNAEALLQKAGIDSAWLQPGDQRFPARCSDRLWQAAIAASGDESLALDYARLFRPGDLGVLNFGLYASQTLADASERLVRVAPLLNRAFHGTCRVQGEHLVLCIALPYRGASPHRLLAAQAIVLQIWRSLMRSDLAPSEVVVQLAQPSSARADERIRGFFGCPVVYGAAHSSISLPLAVAQRPLPGADAELARSGEQIVTRYLEQLDHQPVPLSMTQAVLRQIAVGLFDQKAVTEHLGVSARTLQRRLAADGTSFKTLLNEARRQMAERYLREGRHTIKEVAYLLGFINLSNFARTCRGWFGVPASQLHKTCDLSSSIRE
ncbi:HTH-type transcriptional regulator VirS [compost metagenome]